MYSEEMIRAARRLAMLIAVGVALMVASACLIGRLLAAEPVGLPTMREHVDTVIFGSSGKRWQEARIWFVRDGKLLDYRLWDDEGAILHTEDGRFALTWTEHGCHRWITFDSLVFARKLPQECFEDNDGPWWAQGRRMATLAIPD